MPFFQKVSPANSKGELRRGRNSISLPHLRGRNGAVQEAVSLSSNACQLVHPRQRLRPVCNSVSCLPSLAEVFPVEFGESPSSVLSASPCQEKKEAIKKITSHEGNINFLWQLSFHKAEAVRTRAKHQKSDMAKGCLDNAADMRCRVAEDTLRKALDEDDEVFSPGSRDKAAAVRDALDEARNALQAVGGAPRRSTVRLSGLILSAKSWLDQCDARRAENRNLQQYMKRVERGEASNWQMTQEDLEERVQAGDLGAVRGGLRARLSPLLRSRRERHRSLLHLACERLGRQEVAASQYKSSAYIKIAEALVRAGAGANVVDDDGMTPLDLAFPGASLAVQDALRKLGLQLRRRSQNDALENASSGACPAECSPSADQPNRNRTESLLAQAFTEETTNLVEKGDEKEDEPAFAEDTDTLDDSKRGPLAQFLATNALLRSQGGWRTSQTGFWKQNCKRWET